MARIMMCGFMGAAPLAKLCDVELVA